VNIDTFSGDFADLAELIRIEWDAHFGDKTHFRYPIDWLRGFFGAPGSDPDLLLEYRDREGDLTGFIGAVPRRYVIDGREVRLGLVTLLTSARRNTAGMVGLELERELFRRAAARGLYGTYHFCLDGQRTPQLLKLAAGVLKTQAVEVESVQSMIGLARPGVALDPADARAVTAEDARVLAPMVEAAGRALPIGRSVTAEELAAAPAQTPPKRALTLLRDGRPIGVCTYARRVLLGKEPTELANIDLLVAPEATPADAKRFGRALAGDAAAHGAAYLVAPRRVPALFPYAREMGLRLAARILRVFVVPSAPGSSPRPDGAHLLEVE